MTPTTAKPATPTSKKETAPNNSAAKKCPKPQHPDQPTGNNSPTPPQKPQKRHTAITTTQDEQLPPQEQTKPLETKLRPHRPSNKSHQTTTRPYTTKETNSHQTQRNTMKTTKTALTLTTITIIIASYIWPTELTHILQATLLLTLGGLIGGISIIAGQTLAQYLRWRRIRQSRTVLLRARNLARGHYRA